MILNTNQHAANFTAGPALHEEDEEEDGGDTSVVQDDDGDENYVTESDGEGDDIHVELPPQFVTGGYGKSGQVSGGNIARALFEKDISPACDKLEICPLQSTPMIYTSSMRVFQK